MRHCLGTAFIRDCIKRTSTIELSSMTSRSQSRGFSSLRLKPKALGSNSSSRWMVLASMPVASVMRLAARPVGAQSSSFTRFAARMRRIELTMVVLPTPGPPVITMTFDLSARRIASAWLGASVRAVRFLDPRQRLVGIDLRPGQGTCPDRSRSDLRSRARRGKAPSERCSPPRQPGLP